MAFYFSTILNICRFVRSESRRVLKFVKEYNYEPLTTINLLNSLLNFSTNFATPFKSLWFARLLGAEVGCGTSSQQHHRLPALAPTENETPPSLIYTSFSKSD